MIFMIKIFVVSKFIEISTVVDIPEPIIPNEVSKFIEISTVVDI